MEYTNIMNKLSSTNTGFTDKFGRPLYIGDIIQYYLSGIGPSGPQLLQIARNKKGVIKLIYPGDPDKVGWVMRHTDGKYTTLIDTQYREKDSATQND